MSTNANLKTAVKLGFTLVELLVVIAIIGVLVALLLPAVQAARESARRTQCLGNFKQIGIALQNHHSAKNTFPMGIEMWDRRNARCANPDGVGSHTWGWSWGVYILPYMEQQHVYDMFDFSERSWGAPKSFLAGAHQIPAYECPSDPQRGEWLGGVSGQWNGNHEEEDVFGLSVAGVADSIDWTCGGLRWPGPDKNGILYQLSKTSAKDITDGLSNTLIVGEVVGQGPGTYRGYYWLTWNILHTANGINLPLQLIRSQGFFDMWGPADGGFASYHPGGCHFTLADGSARFISEDVDQVVLAALSTRAEGDIVGQEF